MKTFPARWILSGLLCLAAGFAAWSPQDGSAQWPFGASTTPEAQRSALNAVRSQVNWLQNATKTATSYGPQGADNLYQQFQTLRGTYATFRQTLDPQRMAAGANSFAEIDAGLDIIEEAFGNYQNDVAAGRHPNTALRDLCQVLREGSRLWWQELNKCCSRLRVGWP